MRSRATDDEPGLRPADELVAGERHEVGAGGQPLARHRLVGQAERRRVEQGAGPEVVDDDRAVARGRASASAAGSGASTNPAWRSSRGGRGGRRRARPSASGVSKSAARVRFVVPTSMSRAPARRTISGIRTPPPISTSSPRDTATPPPRPASPRRARRAAALLLVTSASSAPVRAMRWSSATAKRAPRRPVSRSSSRSR